MVCASSSDLAGVCRNDQLYAAQVSRVVLFLLFASFASALPNKLAPQVPTLNHPHRLITTNDRFQNGSFQNRFKFQNLQVLDQAQAQAQDIRQKVPTIKTFLAMVPRTPRLTR